jgi:kumamolisin
LFQLAAVVGTSLFVAAGDNGSSTCQVQAVAAVVSLADTLVKQFGDLPSVVDDYLEDLADEAIPEAAQADPTIGYPASSPWVTAVGGTQLVLGEDNAILRESVWNDLPYLPTSLVNLVGTGGASSIFTAPWYQSPLTRRNMRSVPDISALAAVSPGMAIFVNGELQTSGGTSESSPLTAAGSALVSQALENEGAAPLGFLNPWLYETAKAHPRLVTDVVAGSTQYPVQYAQDSVNTPACCQAGRGYDSASGFGSLRYEEFLARALR